MGEFWSVHYCPMSRTNTGRGAVVFVVTLFVAWFASPIVLSWLDMSATQDPWDITWLTYPIWLPAAMCGLVVVVVLLFSIGDGIIDLFRGRGQVSYDAYVQDQSACFGNQMPPIGYRSPRPVHNGDGVRADLERCIKEKQAQAPAPVSVETFDVRLRRERLQQLFGEQKFS